MENGGIPFIKEFCVLNDSDSLFLQQHIYLCSRSTFCKMNFFSSLSFTSFEWKICIGLHFCCLNFISKIWKRFTHFFNRTTNENSFIFLLFCSRYFPRRETREYATKQKRKCFKKKKTKTKSSSLSVWFFLSPSLTNATQYTSN